jgi:hypothetical protein
MREGEHDTGVDECLGLAAVAEQLCDTLPHAITPQQGAERIRSVSGTLQHGVANGLGVCAHTAAHKHRHTEAAETRHESTRVCDGRHATHADAHLSLRCLQR